jgi:nucleotidyltransferase/DNA polymerase involved in DNA repair
MKKQDKIESLHNIGPVTAAKLNKIGIRTAEDFLKHDPYEIFEKLRKEIDPTLCRCALAVIVGASEGISWYKITKKSAREYERRHPYHRWGKC